MFTILHGGGGSFQFITILQQGGGVYQDPKFVLRNKWKSCCMTNLSSKANLLLSQVLSIMYLCSVLGEIKRHISVEGAVKKRNKKIG